MVTMIQPSLLTVVGHLAVALGLASLIGLEREYRQKSAGLRTNALVGLGAALFMVISKYGFFDVLEQGIRFDPSRIAAQVVTGIGFIGGGIIFVRRSDVRGLTTAAGVWLTAAVGMAAGAGLLAVAAIATVAYYLVAFSYPHLIAAVRRSRPAPWLLHLEYFDGHGALRAALAEATRRGFEIGELHVARDEPVSDQAPENGSVERPSRDTGLKHRVHVELELVGRSSPLELADALGGIDGMRAVRTEDPREEPR